MYRRIIVGHDFEQSGRDALALGQRLASATGAKLVAANVVPFAAIPYGSGILEREEQERLETELRAIADPLGAEAEVVVSLSPARGLHDLAEETEADLIVVGSSHHARAGQVIAGNVGVALLHGAPCAVAVAPREYADEPSPGIATIVVGVDGEREAGLALGHAIALARATGASLEVVTVAEDTPVVYGRGGHTGIRELQDAVEEHRRHALEAAMEEIPSDIHAEASLLAGDPAQRLGEAAAAKGALLVVGSRGFGPVRRVLLGSVSAELMRSARCPVLVHPRGVAAEGDSTGTATTAEASR
jgi:nucleotide-binding universal stress UspA family protein